MYKIRHTNSQKTQQLKPGTYRGLVTEVSTPDGYIENSAFKIVYALSTLEGKSVQNFFEIFWNITSNERTHQLDELLRRLGLEYVDDLVGTTVKLIIKKNTGSRGAMLTIVSREPWSEEVTVTSEGES